MLKKDYPVRRTQNMMVIICFTQFKSTYKSLESNRLEVFLFLDEKQSVFQIIYIYLRVVRHSKTHLVKMKVRDEKLKAIIDWSKNNRDIRAVLLTSSLVNPLAP